MIFSSNKQFEVELATSCTSLIITREQKFWALIKVKGFIQVGIVLLYIRLAFRTNQIQSSEFWETLQGCKIHIKFKYFNWSFTAQLFNTSIYRESAAAPPPCAPSVYSLPESVTPPRGRSSFLLCIIRTGFIQPVVASGCSGKQWQQLLNFPLLCIHSGFWTILERISSFSLQDEKKMHIVRVCVSKKLIKSELAKIRVNKTTDLNAAIKWSETERPNVMSISCWCFSHGRLHLQRALGHFGCS